MSEAVTPSPEANTPEAPKPTPPAPKQESNDIPEWARNEITKKNTEAAGLRVQLREANAQRESLAEQVASLTSEKTQAVNASASIQTDFDKLVTAVKALAPEDNKKFFAFAQTLQGTSEDDLTNHASELTSLFGIHTGPSPAYDRSQGQSGDPLSTDVGHAFGAFMNSQLSK